MSLAYRLDGPTGLPLEGAWYASKLSRNWGMAGMRDVLRGSAGARDAFQVSCVDIVDMKKDDKNKTWHSNETPLDYIAVDVQTSSVALVPQKADPDEVWVDDIGLRKVGRCRPKERQEADRRFVRLTSKPVWLAPDEMFHRAPPSGQQSVRARR